MYDVQYYKSVFDKYGGLMRTAQLAEDEDMQIKWRYFLKTLGNPDIAFADVMEGIKNFLLPVREAITAEEELQILWSATKLEIWK